MIQKDIAAGVDFRRTQSVLGRFGLRLANTWFFGLLPSCQTRQFIAWLRADIWRDFKGKSKTFFSSEDGPLGIVSNLRGNWFENTLGVTVKLTGALSFYGSFTGDVYLNGRGHSYNGIAGFKADF